MKIVYKTENYERTKARRAEINQSYGLSEMDVERISRVMKSTNLSESSKQLSEHSYLEIS